MGLHPPIPPPVLRTKNVTFCHLCCYVTFCNFLSGIKASQNVQLRPPAVLKIRFLGGRGWLPWTISKQLFDNFADFHLAPLVDSPPGRMSGFTANEKSLQMEMILKSTPLKQFLFESGKIKQTSRVWTLQSSEGALLHSFNTYIVISVLTCASWILCRCRSRDKVKKKMSEQASWGLCWLWPSGHRHRHTPGRGSPGNSQSPPCCIEVPYPSTLPCPLQVQQRRLLSVLQRYTRIQFCCRFDGEYGHLKSIWYIYIYS